MDEIVKNLEHRIRSLTQKHAELKKINSELNQSKQRLVHEKEHLLVKYKNVAGLVESTLAKLKSIEGLT